MISFVCFLKFIQWHNVVYICVICFYGDNHSAETHDSWCMWVASFNCLLLNCLIIYLAALLWMDIIALQVKQCFITSNNANMNIHLQACLCKCTTFLLFIFFYFGSTFFYFHCSQHDASCTYSLSQLRHCVCVWFLFEEISLFRFQVT